MKNSELWALLEDQLSDTYLDDGAGHLRLADVGEFMLMTPGDSLAGFKHRNSRNYVFLVREPGTEGWSLHVPCEPKPFHRGFFPA